jgi:hypothetical protein
MSERTTSEGTRAQAPPVEPEEPQEAQEPQEAGEPGEPQEPEETEAPEARKPARRIPASALTTTVAGVAVAVIGLGIYFATSGSAGSRTASGHTPSSVRGVTSSASAASAGRSISGPMPGAPRTPQAAVSASASTPARTQPGPRPIKPTNPAPVESWDAGQGGKALSAITAQSGSVLMAHSAGQYSEMLQSCQALASAVQAARTAPVIPDSAMQAKYAASLTAFGTAGAECTAAITQSTEGVEDTVTNVDQAKISQSISELNVGIADLYAATEVLRKQ